MKEIKGRLQFLVDVGLDYLSLSRATGTLSGGEAQRIRLATQIGSGLVGVAYIMDEPSIGLHQNDNVIKPIVLPAVKQRISQLRLDEFSMKGLGKNVRYELNGIGEMEDLIFNYFLDEKGNTFKRTTWERDPKNNKIILEGVVSNGI